MKINQNQAWDNASAIARAFSIGKNEAAAIANLTTKVSHKVVATLQDAFRSRGMRPFLLHEVVGEGLFNQAFTSGVGTLEPWSRALTNNDDDELVSCH